MKFKTLIGISSEVNYENLGLVILIIFLLMPTHFKSVSAESDIDIVAAEGMVGVAVNTIQLNSTDAQPETNFNACKCNGTKLEKSPDGITNIPCRCRANCQCNKGMVFGVEPEVKNSHFVYVFGANWCGPCHVFKDVDVPKLKQSGWHFSNDRLESKSHAVLVDVDKDPELFAKYAKGTKSIPFYVVIQNGKVVKEHEGYWNYLQFAKEYTDTVE